MAELDLNALRAWKPESVIAAADEAGRRTDAFESAVDDIKSLTNEAAGRSSGSGEQARFAHVDKTVSFAYEKTQLMREHQQLVQEAGYDLAAKHNRLFTAIQAAQQAGLVVTSIGTVEGDWPRQSQELLDKHAESVGRAKHALELADAEHARKIRDSNAKIKEGAESGFHAADSVQKIGNFKDDPVDPKKVPSAPKEPVIHDNDPSWPHGKQVHLGLNLPPYEPGTLSNEEVRTVYVRGEMEVDRLVQLERGRGLSEEQVARNAFERRNAIRTWCRQLMVDRAAADNLNQTRPNLTWEQLLQKEAAKGNTGEAAYRNIAESAVRSNPSVNEKTGVDPKNPPPLPPVRSAPQPAPPPEPRPAEPPSAGRMRPEPEGGGGGRMRPQILGEVVPPGSVAGQYGEQRRGD